MVLTLTTTSNSCYLFLLLFVVCLVILIKLEQKYKQESLIEYFIYLTNKIVLFFIMFNSLIIFSILIVDPEYIVNNFLKQLIKMILLYSFFNYGFCYFIKFWVYVKEFNEKNELYNVKLLKDKNIGGLEK